MRPDASYLEKIAIAFTASKLLLAAAIASTIALHSPRAVPLAFLVVYVLADILDGVLARAWGVDSNTRRMLDAIVDKVSIHAALLACVLTTPGILIFYIPLMIRDLAVSLGYFALITQRGRLFVGPSTHKLSSVCCAAFGVAALGGAPEAIWATSLLALLVNYVLLIDAAGVFACSWAAAWNDSPQGLYRLALPNWSGARYLLSLAIYSRMRAQSQRPSDAHPPSEP